MKMRREHIVPLSRQAIEMLKQQKEETGHLNTDWVFPSQVRPQNPMSDGGVLYSEVGNAEYESELEIMLNAFKKIKKVLSSCAFSTKDKIDLDSTFYETNDRDTLLMDNSPIDFSSSAFEIITKKMENTIAN